MNKKIKKTVEPQYQECLELCDQEGLFQLGLMSSHTWHIDPKRLLFVLSRYKFVSRMLQGRTHALEVGCADAFGTRIVLQEVGNVTAVDIDTHFIDDVRCRQGKKWKFDCMVHDMLDGPVAGDFDGAYCLDVIEHISVEKEKLFVSNLADSITEHGVLIVGTPSLHSQAYASPLSKEGHINCKDHKGLKDLMSLYFHHVFIFSMNDEVIHTGFYPMAHYLMALCCGKKTVEKKPKKQKK